MNNSSKLSKILTAVIVIISVIAAVLFFGVITKDESDSEALYGAVSPLVEYSAWLLYITVAITVIFSIVTLLKEPESLKKILINLGFLGAVFAVSYVLASDNAVLDVQGQILEGGEAGSTSKLISTLINYSVGLGAIAIAAIGFGAVKSAIK